MEEIEITDDESAPMDQIGEIDVTEDNKYLFQNFLIKEEAVDCTNSGGLNEHVASSKRSLSESRTLEYYAKIKKPFIKTEDNISSDSSVKEIETDEILVEADQVIKYLAQLHPESEYDGVSNNFTGKLDHFDFVFDQASTSKTEYNVKPEHFTYVQNWLQQPAYECTMQSENLAIGNHLDKDLSDDDDDADSDPPSSDQFSVQQSQSSETPYRDFGSTMFSPQNVLRMDVGKQLQFCGFEPKPVSQQVNYRVYSEDRNKTVSDLPKLKSIKVQKWKKITNTVKDHCRVRKTSNKKDRLHGVTKRPHHHNLRVTRSLVQNIESIVPTDSKPKQIGQFVWGYCRGWWPALIVAAEDGGLESLADKVCVYWIAEDLISQLDEKTHVEPFATNLYQRLMKYLQNDEGSKDRKKACFVTLKLFSKQLDIPLLKPYTVWAKKHLMGKEHLNDTKFHPLPKNIQQRLEQLKRQNNKVTEKMARDQARAMKISKESSSPADQDPIKSNSPDEKTQDNGTESKFPKDFVRQSAKEMLVKAQEEKHILPLKEQQPGVIVWGKITGHSWWPAIIIHHNDCGKKEPNFGCQWILWYGDYKLSQVHYLNVMKFEEGIKKMQENITQCRRDMYMKAVLNSCKDHCARFSYDTTSWTMDNVLAWVSSLNTNLKMPAISRPNDGRLESRYSSHIAAKLNEMKSNQIIAAEREDRISNCDALKAVFAGVPNTLKVLCIICLEISYTLLDHPFFECAVCSDCVEEIKATIFAYGDDGKCFYCTLCTGSDTVVMCDSVDCPRVYCTACLKYLISPTDYDDIMVKDPWLCFQCVQVQDANNNRIFKPRSDWKTRVGQLFHTNQDTSWNNAWKGDEKPRKLRVLSLFDGISTGLLTLDKLGIEVEDYYTSEIDVDAELVSSVYFGDRICRLGDVRNITKDIIDAITPIDLLIGGSPCNDLSLVNVNRLGLHDPKGTGVLFFDYCRIKELVLEANRGRHLFWLFENVASMPSEYRLAMNESLECEPRLIDAADFSPQHRPRLFWGNIPRGANFPPPDPSQDLQNVLAPNCNRHALVKKIRTVTTQVNSLKQGVSLMKPVLMNGVADSLWITELEDIFGLPKHYTDVKNLPATKRQKLIGQAWSVQTITAILSPLSYLFITKSLPARNNQ